MSPTPLDMPSRRVQTTVETSVQVDLPAHDDSKTYSMRPGVVNEILIHDGVVKAKHLKPGMKVRSFLHGEPRGSVKEVGTVERIDDGAYVHITWASGHPEADYKAAYRFFSDELYGSTMLVKRRGLVPHDA